LSLHNPRGELKMEEILLIIGGAIAGFLIGYGFRGMLGRARMSEASGE